MSVADDDPIEEAMERTAKEKSAATAEKYEPLAEEWRDWLHEREKTLWTARPGDVRKFLRAKLPDDGSQWTEGSVSPGHIGSLRSAVRKFYEKIEEAREEGMDFPEPDHGERRSGVPIVNPVEEVDLDWNYLEIGSVKSDKLREDITYLKPEQVRELVDNAPEPAVRNKLLIKLLFQCGLRREECSTIRVRDVDREERSINIRGKGAKDRTVYYRPSLDTLMRLWLETERPGVYGASESEYLFVTRNGEHITGSMINKVVKKAVAASDLHDDLKGTYMTDTNGGKHHVVTAHTLRHSFAMQWIDNNEEDIWRLSTALGHESVETTRETYLHNVGDIVERGWKANAPDL